MNIIFNINLLYGGESLNKYCMDKLYKNYREWIYYNHIRYYEKSGMTSCVYSPDKKELNDKCKDKFGELVKDPVNRSEWGFINVIIPRYLHSE